jgi:hypothetical protein
MAYSMKEWYVPFAGAGTSSPINKIHEKYEK